MTAPIPSITSAPGPSARRSSTRSSFEGFSMHSTVGAATQFGACPKTRIEQRDFRHMGEFGAIRDNRSPRAESSARESASPYDGTDANQSTRAPLAQDR